MVEKEENIEQFRSLYLDAFKKGWSQEPRREEIMEIARRNTEGKLWLFGGAVYRTIIEEIYGQATRRREGVIDIDFIAEKMISHKPLYIPLGWDIRLTNSENIYLEASGLKIDLNSLRGYASGIHPDQDPSIEEVLQTTPFNVQSIAYDCDSDSLLGRGGIRAIRNRTVKINEFGDLFTRLAKSLGEDEELLYNVLNGIVKNKADDLRMSPILLPIKTSKAITRIKKETL